MMGDPVSQEVQIIVDKVMYSLTLKPGWDYKPEWWHDGLEPDCPGFEINPPATVPRRRSVMFYAKGDSCYIAVRGDSILGLSHTRVYCEFKFTDPEFPQNMINELQRWIEGGEIPWTITE